MFNNIIEFLNITVDFTTMFLACIARPKVGETVRERLKRLYQDHTAYSYKDARTIMYNQADCENNQMWLQYSGYWYDWTCGGTSIPSSTVINCEHTVPQSLFGKELPMVSDLHHIFASPAKLNNARSNYKFVEADYSECKKFCRELECQTDKPSGDLNDWSCLTNDNTWMPRAEDKGRTARAIFYFYTMYPTEAGDMSLVADVDTLKSWNSQYPPDDREKTRNDVVNQTQGNRNPYVDDYTLVDQAF